MINQEVTISKYEYDQLNRDSIFLNCLRNSGVDNWEWYSEAVEEFNEIYDEGEDE